MRIVQQYLTHNLVLITAAFLLDLVIGDPSVPFHPVRILGRFIRRTEKVLRNSPHFKTLPVEWAGFLGVLIITAVSTAVFFGLQTAATLFSAGKEILGVFTIYITIALKDLSTHGRKVQKALDSGTITEARIRTSYLVTRDTDNLDETALIRCTIESISENASDSVLAPLFWAFIFGPAGSLLYRVINTIDAMWGYKNEKYLYFGRTAALLDDIAGWIPARITGLLICLSAPAAGGSIKRGWYTMLRDHGKTESPNAGYPEAAAAGVLGIKLAGNGRYFGKVKIKPTLGEDLVPISPGHIRLTIRLLYGASLLLLFAFILTALLAGVSL